MNEIKCPHCSTVFTINETEYNQLLDQIRNHEFEKEIQARVDLELKNHKTEFESILRLKESEFRNKLDNELSAKDNEISKLSLLLETAESDLESKISEALLAQKLDSAKTLSKLTSEIQDLKSEKLEFDSKLRLKESEFKNKLDNELSTKDNEISRLTVLLETNESDLEDKIKNALLEQQVDSEKKLNKLESEVKDLKSEKKEFDAKLRLKESEFKNKLDKELSTKDNEISRLNLLLNTATSNAKSENKEALMKQRLDFEEKLNKSALEIKDLKSEKSMLEQNLKEQYAKTISDLEHQLDSFELIKTNEINNLEKSHEVEVKLLQETIETYKDFKARQSTKGIGESLEHFAETEFNKVRSIAFPNAYFAKDNVISKSGSKGDFIFRDYMDGMEFISIMFEMKNEADTTKSKHKNSDFYKELDKDRREKGCEYAVLVSMLEADSDYFNTGIVDVSSASGYEKMYVVRPQFFIQLIGILRNAGLNTIEYKKQIREIQNQNIDVSNFERDLDEFKNLFFKHYTNATDRFGDAIKAIDASIAQMEKIRDALTKSSTHLKRANDRLEDVSVKKLTRNNPTMQAKFAELDYKDL